MADAQGPAGNAFGVAVRRKIEAVRAIAQRDPDGGLAGVVERDAARRRVARLVELQASLRRRRVGVRPCLIDPERLSRSQFIGPGLPSLAIQPPRNPTLLIAKMEAYRLHELKTRQALEEERAEADAIEAKKERERIAKLELEVRKRAVRQSFLKALLAHVEVFKNAAKEENRVLRSLSSQALAWVIAKERRIRTLEDKQQKARMKALRENDMEAYAALLAETKNDRLQTLLNQTEDFLGQLSANNSGAFHSVTEEITVQPMLLKHGTLKQYQLEGLQWLVSLYNNNLNGILADEMGLGKTIQTIALLTYVMEAKGDHGPFMIIVPLSTMSNWVKEFERWAPTVMVVEYQGKPPERKELWRKFIMARKFNVLLTTYEYVLNKHDRSKLESIDWHYIIVDEGHRMKNTKSKFTVALNTRYRSQHRLLLTGTPLQNNLSELWSLLNFLVPKIFNSAENFETWFNKPFEEAGVGDTSAELQEEEKFLIINRLHRVLRPFLLRRLKTEVAGELPDKVERVVKCDLSIWQKQVYKQVQLKFIPMATSGAGVSAKGLNNTFMQLRKICNHPYLFFDDIAYDWDNHRVTDEVYRCSGKFEMLDRMLPKIRKSNHKVLIFTQMTKILDIMEDFMDYRRYPYLRLDGQTKPEHRSKLLELFNAPNSPYFCFLLSTRAGGLGLNLQSADTVIIFDSDWNPQMDLQAQDRAHRLGQQNEVRVFRLVTCSPVEEQILMRAQFKLGLDQMIIQAGKFNHQDSFENTAHERRQMLATVLREGVDMGEQVDLPTGERLNRLLARSEDEFDMFQMIDVEMERERRDLWLAEGNQGPLPPRLMQDINELPDYLRAVEDTAVLKKFNDLGDRGRGARRGEGSTPVYTEMSDAQFNALCVEEEEAEAAGNGKGKRKRASKSTKKVGVQGLMHDLLDAVMNAVNDDGAKLCDPFMDAPDSTEYREMCAPDTEHLAFRLLTANVAKGKYARPSQLSRDVHLMLQNFESWYPDPECAERRQINAIRKLFNRRFNDLFGDEQVSRGKPKRDAADEAQAVGSETESEESDHDLGVVDDDDEEDDVSGVRIIDDVDDDTTAIDDEETPIRSRTKKRRQ
ncbi:SNF2-related domain containing protein [Plasmodiophora brassicae]